MYRNRTKLILGFATLLGLAAFLVFRAWNNRIHTFQGIVWMPDAMIPEYPGTGIFLQTPKGHFELAWESQSKNRKMAKQLKGKNVIVRGIFREWTGLAGRRYRYVRVISATVVAPPATIQSRPLPVPRLR